MEGTGKWFDTRAAARAYAQAHFDAGARSFDVGCFQINYRWHGQAFASIDAMFDPEANALYAARFLARLYRETGDWTEAAGAYHSRTPAFADRYAERFDRIRTGLADAPENPPGASPAARRAALRQNTYPLLQASGTSAGFGSLVPLGAAARPALAMIPVSDES
jgi:soluble lytic murein transglycosylase-like protein